MWKKIRRVDYRHWICLAVLLGSLALGVFVYKYPFYRLIESVVDFGKSFVGCIFHFLKKGYLLPFDQSINEFSKVDLQYYIDIDLEEIYRRLTGLKDQIFVLRNFTLYLFYVLIGFCKFLIIVCCVFIFGIILLIPTFLEWDKVNNDYDEDTGPLKWYKKWVNRPYKAAKACFLDWLSFFSVLRGGRLLYRFGCFILACGRCLWSSLLITFGF